MPISPSLLNRPGRVGVGNAKKNRGEEKDGRGAASPTHSMRKLGKSSSEALISIANFTHDQLRGRAGHVSPVGRPPKIPQEEKIPPTRADNSARLLHAPHGLPNPWSSKPKSPSYQTYVDHRKEDSEDKLHNDHTTCHVMDPYAKWRIRWNIFVLILIIYVIIVVPFEIAFSVDTTGMQVVNYLVDVFFAVDICLEFNTAFQSEDTGEWILDRKKIASQYLRFWFWVDFCSVFPFALFLPKNEVRWMRVVRAFKGLKLLRVIRSFRMLSHMAKHVAVSTKRLVLARYVLLLLFCIHWAACFLRLGHAAYGSSQTTVLSEDRMGQLDSSVPRGRRIWGEYILCCLWAFATMNGEYNVYTDVEYILSLALMLIGCFALAFLVGELTNTVSNLDPVTNDFRMRLDNLNDYMDKGNFPEKLRSKLREYIMESEEIFRDNYYKGVIEELSPSLQAFVANQNFGDVVSRIPFVAYTVQAACGVRVGTVVTVHAPDWKPDVHDVMVGGDERTTKKRRKRAARTRLARVVAIPRYLYYDVMYEDGEEPQREYEVDNARVARVCGNTSEKAAGTMDRNFLLHYEYAEFTVQIAKLLHSTLHLAKDTIIHRYLSMNDALYVIRSGQVRLSGRKSHLLYDVENRHTNDFFGDDISMVVATGEDFKPLLRHYTARAVRVTHLLRLDAEELHTILQKPSFRVFSHHIHNYGRWMRLKVALIMSIRKRLTKEALGESGKPPVIVEETAESPEETASAFGDSSSDEGGALRRQAAFVVERLAGVLARPTSLSADAAAKLEALAAALGNSPPPPPRHSPPRRQNTDPFAPSTLPPAQALGATPPMGRPSSGSTSLEDE